MADYDALLVRWPVQYEINVVPTVLGATSVVSSGPVNAPHLVLTERAQQRGDDRLTVVPVRFPISTKPRSPAG